MDLYPMLQEELKNIEKEIKSMIKILIKEISDLEDSAAPIAPENAIGRISRMDAINNKSVVEASLRNRKKKLSKLQLALSKVYQKGFGECASCGSDINPKRIMLMPQSDRCIKCA